MKQNRFCAFRSGKCLTNFFQAEDLFGIKFEIRRRNKLLVRMRVAFDCFFAQFDQPAFCERAERLIIERSFAQ